MGRGDTGSPDTATQPSCFAGASMGGSIGDASLRSRPSGLPQFPSSQAAASVTPLLKSRRRLLIDTFARPRDTKRLTASPRPDPRVISYRGHQPSFILYYVRDDFLISASDGPFTFLAISMLAPGPPPSASLPVLPDVGKHLRSPGMMPCSSFCVPRRPSLRHAQR